MAIENPIQVIRQRPDESPLYRWVEDDLLTQIEEGQWEPGQALPTERELCDRYDVSRITVRRAIRELETSGYVRRFQGKGTFVSRSRIKREMGHLISFSQEMRAQGRTPSSRLLNLQHCPADHAIASLLQIQKGEPIWIVERMRLADDEVVSLSTSYLHLPPDAYLTPLELNTEQSLWLLLEQKGIQITEGSTIVSAIVADAHHAGLLEVEEGDPLLVMDGVNYAIAEHPVPVEAFQIISRADRYQYSLHLVRMDDKR